MPSKEVIQDAQDLVIIVWRQQVVMGIQWPWWRAGREPPKPAHKKRR